MSDKYMRELIKAINKSFEDMAEKQAVFNEAFYELLNDKQKEDLIDRLEEFKRPKEDIVDEDIQKMFKEVKK